MSQDHSPVVAGVVAAVVGFSSSFVVVLAGLAAVGATPAQAASGLLALCVAQALGMAADAATVILDGVREERWRMVAEKVRSRGVVAGPTRVIGRQEAALSDTRAAPRSSPTGGPAKRRPTISAPGAGGVPPRPRKKKR